MTGSKNHKCDKAADRRRAAMIAIAWFVRMRSADRTPEDERRFRAWLEEDGSHAATYAEIEGVWDTARDLDTLPGLQVMRQEALRPRTGFLRRAIPRRGIGTALSLPGGRTVRRVAAAAAAVAVLTAAGLGLSSLVSTGDPVQLVYVFETAEGQRHEFTLPDGSFVTLTSDSRLTMLYCDQMRRIRLSRGEAYFRVAHDPVRPFRVYAGSGTVTALGTEFDVYNKNGEVAVVLVNGSVEVAALESPAEGPRQRRLNPGEQVFYDRHGISAVREVNAERAVAWRTGRISVVDEPLLNVIDKMNRHSGRMLKVDRSDPRLRELKVTGQFTTGRPELLIQYLEAAGIEVWAQPYGQSGDIMMRLRHAGSTTEN